MITTPRPYQIGPIEHNIAPPMQMAITIYKEGGNLVIYLGVTAFGQLTIDEKEMMKKANLIVRAVNLLDVMEEAKAALEALILTDTKRAGITVNPHELYCDAVAKAKAVLAKMEDPHA